MLPAHDGSASRRVSRSAGERDLRDAVPHRGAAPRREAAPCDPAGSTRRQRSSRKEPLRPHTHDNAPDSPDSRDGNLAHQDIGMIGCPAIGCPACNWLCGGRPKLRPSFGPHRPNCSIRGSRQKHFPASNRRRPRRCAEPSPSPANPRWQTATSPAGTLANRSRRSFADQKNA
jgi:hypothetical protein